MVQSPQSEQAVAEVVRTGNQAKPCCCRLQYHGSLCAAIVQVYVCAAFLACWQKDILTMEFQELMMFLQKLPTQDWQDLQIESILSNAYVLRNTWGNAQSHLQT